MTKRKHAASLEAPDAIVQETLLDLLELFDVSKERDPVKVRAFTERLQSRLARRHKNQDVLEETLRNEYESRLSAIPLSEAQVTAT